jgi:uncharacterized damage-inducible protein DinB
MWRRVGRCRRSRLLGAVSRRGTVRIMDAPTRTEPPLRGSEVDTLRSFLAYHRETFRWKTQDLNQQQLATPLSPSTMTLGGMMKHLAVVESSWFSEDFRGGPLMAPFDTAPWEEDRDWEWHTAAQDSPEQLRALFDDAVTRSDRIIEEALARGGLDQLSVAKDHRTGEPYSLRWILVHMIEEYARHNGHADLIRESIDGMTGE